MTQVATNSPPECFGRSWNSSRAICSGGLDPAYKDPVTGMHVRNKCAWYDNCSTRTMANQARPQNLIPVESLNRNQPVVYQNQQPAPQQQTNWVSAAEVERIRREAAQQGAQQVIRNQQALPQYPQQNPYYQPNQVPVQQAPMIHPQYQVHPVQMVPMSSYMPSYLTAPEQLGPGDSMFGALMRSLFRSAGKSMGHSLAHFFDVNPFNRNQGGGQ